MARVSQPRPGEPIRLIETGRGPRYRVVIDTASTGAPRKQVTRTFVTLTEAREFVSETRSRVRRGHYIAPDKITVRELAGLWLEELEAESRSPGGVREVTVNGYRSALDAPLRHIGDRQAQSITPADARALLRALATEGGKWKRGLSHRSIVYALGALRRAYAHGVENRRVSSNPFAEVRPPRERHTKADAAPVLRWSPAEVARFRQEADRYAEGDRFAAEPWLRAGMRLTLTGMRRSEVLGLDWQRVDMQSGAIDVVQGRVKTGRRRATALGEVKAANSLRIVQADEIHAGTAAALRALWLAQGRPRAGLVICEATGEPVDPDRFSARFRDLCADAGVPALTRIHNVRHSLATALEAAGVPAHEAAALLGHDVDTYRRFYLVTDNNGAAAAARAAGRIFAVTG